MGSQAPQELVLLFQASQEIKKLRRENELMSARLNMFDTITKMLHTNFEQRNGGMTPDLVWEIDKFVESRAKESEDKPL
jgi:hypothetical protein